MNNNNEGYRIVNDQQNRQVFIERVIEVPPYGQHPRPLSSRNIGNGENNILAGNYTPQQQYRPIFNNQPAEGVLRVQPAPTPAPAPAPAPMPARPSITPELHEHLPTFQNRVFYAKLRGNVEAYVQRSDGSIGLEVLPKGQLVLISRPIEEEQAPRVQVQPSNTTNRRKPQAPHTNSWDYSLDDLIDIANELFTNADTNKSGYLDRFEVSIALKSIYKFFNFAPPHDTVIADFAKRADKNKDGRLSREEYIEIFLKIYLRLKEEASNLDH